MDLKGFESTNTCPQFDCNVNMALWQYFKRSRRLIQIPLFVTFSLLFAFPAIKTYQKKEVSIGSILAQKLILQYVQIWLKALVLFGYIMVLLFGFAMHRWLQSHLRRKRMDFLLLQFLSWPWTPRDGGAIYRLKNVKNLKIKFCIFWTPLAPYKFRTLA